MAQLWFHCGGSDGLTLCMCYVVPNRDWQWCVRWEQRKDKRNGHEKSGRDGNKCEKAPQSNTKEKAQNASATHGSSEISFIWHRGTMAANQDSHCSFVLGNTKCTCAAPASQGKITQTSSHPAVCEEPAISHLIHRPRAATHLSAVELENE